MPPLDRPGPLGGVTDDRPARVTILGAGLMGAQIGVEYAVAGFEVVLSTTSAASGERALRRAEQCVRTLVRTRLMPASERKAVLGRIHADESIEHAAEGAQIVVESVDEDFEIKVDALKRAAQAAPNATLASNTSALSITNLGRAIGAAERFVGTHYWNPPSLMPLVEVVPGADTDRRRVELVCDLLTRLGKTPLIVADIPGFVWNRLQLALIREAVALVRDGATTPAVIDEIAVRGFGRRWSSLGPFASMAAGGTTTVARVADLIVPTLADDVSGDDILALDLQREDDLDAKIVSRDRALARQLRVERLELEVT